MKKQLKQVLVMCACSSLLFSACSKENAPDGGEDTVLEFRATPSSLSITAAWAQGATTMLTVNSNVNFVHAAQTNTVKVWNNLGGTSGRIGFQRWDQRGTAHFGRTLGTADNGTASHAFAWSSGNWAAAVPFAFGTRGTREAIWTPAFENVGIPAVAMSELITDNSPGDENPTAGIIEVGDFRAIDGDFHENRPNAVIFRKLVGTNWEQLGRTNGQGDHGNLLAFTVLKVRTAFTISGGKVTAQTFENVPIAKIERMNNKKRLITDLPFTPIGSQMMYEY